jgi:hypothetical protein
MKWVDLADLCIILCLDKRQEYWSGVAKQFTDRDLPVELFIAGDGSGPYQYNHIDTNELPPKLPHSTSYGTWHSRVAPFNALKCHRKMLQKAIDYDLDSVLMLEDDCELTSDADEVLSHINTPYWDMFYLGAYNKYAQKSAIDKNLLKICGSGGFHAVVIKKNLFKELISLPSLGPLDYMCATYLHPRIEAIAVHPAIAVQRSGFSFIEGHNLEKPPRDEL